WGRVGREPSGSAFDSLAQLEYELGVPRNPFINSGALVVTDHLLTLSPDDSHRMLEFLRAELADGGIGFDADVVSSELEFGSRNAAIGYLLKSYDNLENEVPAVLRRYYEHCAIRLSCRELAVAASFLGNGGLRRDGPRLLTARQAKRVNAVMLTSGTYDSAGEFAYRVGLPVKSGVGGGIVAVVPGRCTISVWGPGLGASGNSVAGAAALDEFTTRTGWSIF